MKLSIQNSEAARRAGDIRLLLLDVDGVLTDGQLYFSSSGEETKAFNTLDGHGIRLLMANGIDVGIISGRNSGAVSQRAQDLGMQLVYLGYRNKLEALQEILSHGDLDGEHIAYVGDDLPDLPVMQAVGLSFAVANAHASVKQAAHCMTRLKGGRGAVREICDFILQHSRKEIIATCR